MSDCKEIDLKENYTEKKLVLCFFMCGQHLTFTPEIISTQTCTFITQCTYSSRNLLLPAPNPIENIVDLNPAEDKTGITMLQVCPLEGTVEPCSRSTPRLT